LANITVPLGPVTGAQDETILISGLFAELVDTVTTNGAEFLSTTISNVPEDTIFSAGVQTGFGTWVIPPEDLPTLQITPPPYFAGNFSLVSASFCVMFLPLLFYRSRVPIHTCRFSLTHTHCLTCFPVV
jgi:hypothetical protein